MFKKRTGITRRDFLKVSSVAGGLLATAPIHSALGFVGTPLRLGIMLPETSRYPRLSKNFLNGFELYLREHGSRLANRSASLAVESIGVSRWSAVKTAETFVNQGVDVVIGYVGTPAIEAMRPVFDDKNTLLVACNAGENVLRNENRHQNILHNTLNLWQANWAAGQWMVDQYGKRGMVISAYHESGYDLPYSFELGVTAAGGVIEKSIVTNNNGLSIAIDTIHQLQPDFVYAAFSGDEAEAFMSAFRATGLNTPVVGTAFMPVGAYLPTSWIRHFASEENRQFVSAFKRYNGEDADLFAVLGYETAQLIDQTTLSRSEIQLTSPRGTISFNGERVKSPLYMQHNRGAYQALAFPADQTIAATVEATSVKTGWVNPYLV